jgi:DNA-binding NarL/FixJ family response regulator
LHDHAARRALLKLGCANRAQVAIVAHDAGLLDD